MKGKFRAVLLLLLAAAMLVFAGCSKDAKQVQKADQTLDELVADDAFQSLDETAQHEQIMEVLEQMASDGLIQTDSVTYDEHSGLYTFTYANGNLGGLCTKVPNEDWNTASSQTGSTDSDAPVGLDGEGLSVLILNGFEDRPYRRDYYEALETEWDDAGLDASLDTDVSVADMKDLGGNDVVVFAMHGSMFRGTPVLCMNESVTDAKDAIYREDLDNGRIARVTLTTGTRQYWVLPTLFSESYESLDVDLIFSESCQFFGCDCTSDMDESFANALLDLTGGTVIGYHNSVGANYSRDVMRDTINALLEGDTFADALQAATDVHGTEDNWVDAAEDKFSAFPVLRSRGPEVLVHTPVTSFVTPEELVVTIGELSVIEPEIEPEGAAGYSISWTSSDEQIVSVTPSGDAGIITAHAKGTATITATLTSGRQTLTAATEVRVASKSRDTVLVLDISGSMSGTPMDEMKQAAVQFCNELLVDEYNNRVGLVFYDDTIRTVGLTSDLNTLITRINEIESGGRTNMEAGLSAADSMLRSEGREGAIHNVVIMADGLPNEGKTSSSGSMSYGALYFGSYTAIEYASAVIDTARQMMTGYNLYSLGFFHDLYFEELNFASALMKELTNQTDGYYQVEEAENLQFAFGDISEEISVGSKIVINIACPVDVTVSYNGESLSSAEKTYCDRTSFGTLQLLGKNKDIKVLSLDSDKQYEIELHGTGTGTMDYTISYYDERETLVDYRTFEQIPITDTTVIHTDTDNVSKDIALDVDQDGDGEVDFIWTAKPRAKAKITYQKDRPGLNGNTLMIIFVSVAAVLTLLMMFVMILSGAGNGKKRRRARSPEIRTSKISKSAAPAIVTPVNEAPVKQTPDPAKPAAETEEAPFRGGVLEIISGTMKDYRIPIRSGETLMLGKDPKVSHVVFDKSYVYVSRLHCTIEYSGESNVYYVVDASSNGTLTNGKTRLVKGKRTMLTPGSVLLLGNEDCTIVLG